MDQWISGLPLIIEGSRALVLGMDDDFEFYPLSGDPMVRSLWETNKDSRDFQEGLQSVYYLLP